MKFFPLAFLLIWVKSLDSQSSLNVPFDYPTIQEALDTAAKGDSIFVFPGTYFENIEWPFAKDLQVIGVEGSEQTIIDGGGTERVLLIDSLTDKSLFQGFTLQNGLAEGIGGHGAGMMISRSALLLKDLIIRDNVMAGPGWGTGAYLVFHEGDIDSCRFIDNVNISDSDAGGIGLYLEATSDVEILSCEFTNNQSMSNISRGGGGLFLWVGILIQQLY